MSQERPWDSMFRSTVAVARDICRHVNYRETEEHAIDLDRHAVLFHLILTRFPLSPTFRRQAQEALQHVQLLRQWVWAAVAQQEGARFDVR